MTANDVQDNDEKTSAILVTAIVLSLVVHLGLMFALEDCSFNTIADSVGHTRKWTRQLPKMHVQRHVGDPLAAAENVRGRPAAAPVTESVAERVARLTPPTTALSPAATPAQKAADASIPPPEMNPTEWKVRPKLDILDHPVMAEEQPPEPTPIRRADSPLKGVDILPPMDMPSVPTEKLLVAPVAPVAAPADLTPPEIGLGTGAPAVGPVDFAGVFSGEKSIFGNHHPPEAVKPPEIVKPPKPKPVVKPKEIPLPVLSKVDEKVVAREKKAVQQLRDEQEAQPLARHVACSLAYWIDPAHRDFKYFRLQITSNPRQPLDVVSKDVVYLLDASGSIANDRLKACRRAVVSALQTLNSHDRFNVVAFRDKFGYLFNAWHEVDADSVQRAEKWLHGLYAHGRTDVFATLRSVLAIPRSPARPLIAVVITDGEATSGLTRSTEIISSFTELNDGLVAVYMYGVKDEANAYLMDMLTRLSRGEWYRHEGFRRSAASGIPDFVKRFADPILTDVTVTFAAAACADVYPKRVTHLYKDRPIEIVGVCPAAQRDLAFVVRGLNGEQACEDVFKLTFPAEATLSEEVKRQWAQQRLYALAGEYALNPSPALLRDLKLFSSHYNVAIPYENELGKTPQTK